jgi:hypothetical protein
MNTGRKGTTMNGAEQREPLDLEQIPTAAATGDATHSHTLARLVRLMMATRSYVAALEAGLAEAHALVPDIVTAVFTSQHMPCECHAAESCP